MRIAILGTRGIPASYGGFETFAEHLSTRLVARGHEVTVYCRAHYVSPRQMEYHGVRLQVLPTIRAGTVSLPKGLWRRSTRNGATATALALQLQPHSTMTAAPPSPT